MPVNRNLVLISGEGGAGKSASLRTLKNPEGVMYLNCEAGKELPFADEFEKYVMTHPKHVLSGFRSAETKDHIHTIVVDSLTYLMDMVQRIIVNKEHADNTQQGWNAYKEYYQELIQELVAGSSKNVIMTAHTSDIYDQKNMSVKTKVKIAGSIMNTGVESYFCNVISAKKMPLQDLENYHNDLLNITDEDKILGYKHVFQTRLTADTVNESIRGPMQLWPIEKTYIDNDAQLFLDHLHTYYNKKPSKTGESKTAKAA